MPLRVVPRRDRKLNRHIRKCEVISLKKGDVLHYAGAPADRVVLVRSGHLRLVVPDSPGCSARTVDIVGPWEIAGEEALVPRARRRYGAVAGEASSVQTLDPGAVHAVLSTSRVTLEAFLTASSEDLAFQHHLCSGSGHPPAAGRVASVLLHLARRFGEPVDGATRIPVRLTHQTLADLSGTHRSTVTTVLNEWLYDQWLVADDDGFRLDDLGALRCLARLQPPR